MIINIFGKKIRYEEIENLSRGKIGVDADTDMLGEHEKQPGTSMYMRPSWDFKVFPGETEKPDKPEEALYGIHYYYYFPDHEYNTLMLEIRKQATAGYKKLYGD